jgi:hypothetical protein
MQIHCRKSNSNDCENDKKFEMVIYECELQAFGSTKEKCFENLKNKIDVLMQDLKTTKSVELGNIMVNEDKTNDL